MLKSLRSYLKRRLHRRAAATLPPRRYGAPATIRPIACGLTNEYLAALRHAVHNNVDGEAPDHEKAADLVRWRYLDHDEHGNYRLTASGQAELDRSRAAPAAVATAAEPVAQA